MERSDSVDWFTKSGKAYLELESQFQKLVSAVEKCEAIEKLPPSGRGSCEFILHGKRFCLVLDVKWQVAREGQPVADDWIGAITLYHKAKWPKNESFEEVRTIYIDRQGYVSSDENKILMASTSVVKPKSMGSDVEVILHSLIAETLRGQMGSQGMLML